MKSAIKASFALACLAFFMVNAQATDYTSKRTLTKSFTTTANAALSVSNEYGMINITEWDKNEVSFEVTIKASAKTQADADEILKTADVDFSQSGSTIAAKTIYKQMKNCNNCSRSVDYQIMVPKSISYQLKNEYGNIAMGNAKGDVAISLEYGNFKGGDFSGNGNTIKVEYGNIDLQKLSGTTNAIKASYAGNISILSTNKLSVKMEYSKLKIGTATDIDIKSEYSDLTIQKVKTLNFVSEYENYTIGEADALTGKAEYTNFDIKQLNQALNIANIEYGKLNIKNVASQFETINVKGSYTPIDIKFDSNTSFNVDASVEYGSISLPSNNSASKTTKDDMTTVKGKVGAGTSPKATITIRNEYSPINLK